MSFSLVHYFAAIAEAEKTGESVDFDNITSERIAEHMPARDVAAIEMVGGTGIEPVTSSV